MCGDTLSLKRFVQSGTVVMMILFPRLLRPADHAQSKELPPIVLKALDTDEAELCKRVSGEFEKSCHQTFIAHLRWRKLQLGPSGQAGILVENRNRGFCGSAGCALHLFAQQSEDSFDEVLDEVGALENMKPLKTVTKGYYDLRKTSSNRKTQTIYRWDGSIYSPE